MAKVALARTREASVPRGPRATPLRLTVYGKGLAKLTPSARRHLGTDEIHILHDSVMPDRIYVSTSGSAFPSKLGKQGSFSAAPLWRHVGRPDRPMHIDLSIDEDGDLMGDLGNATYGENRARMAKSEGVPAGDGSVDPEAASSTEGPEASGPSDTSVIFDPVGDEDDDDEDYDSEDDDLEVVAAVAATAPKSALRPISHRK